ncbi:MAG: methylenetetrahydrofolate--tRNA-(uracil(54)-C(5))-methyltransferase (FADH(2)-oxidizing) TrmFO [Clostridia bacterium]|nr:methylenetetrahydrofolate--tRNA-(uracil(54)-C(5))-methyltransferase (FADH(2)-oxidizing) TrmFO [Clostridia bacterium]MBR6289868.1 methylenetetrahydrofolate--tRNA-(uracil(54)-C(5))-methyltransferase (FADH(2)-oxidizing) TrmFO [Clostridia bacterium]
MRPEKGITVIGAGLAGCEAAAQAARLGVPVTLIEMKPEKKTPAHKSDKFCELVCSNSLRSAEVTNAAGLLKEELRRLGSLVIEACDKTRVSAGGALAVDRELFSGYVTERVRNHPLIRVESREVTGIPEDGITVVATGPLTSDALAADIVRYRGAGGLWFYDAAAPIVSFDSVDMSRAFFASRYGKGTPDYINCPMTEEEYRAFYRELLNAETAELHEFEKSDLRVFEGCMPVEVMARRGEDTLRFGPMKPVGIKHPETGETYYAVVQLRRENEDGTMFNLVGFQTHLTFPEQRRVFGMIPGLENAEFLRYGVMHRNTFLNSPGFLAPDYSVADDGRLFFAGQMTGVEGYVESAASGFVAGLSAALKARGEEPVPFPKTTVIGAMAHYVSEGGQGDFQPMNANFGVVSPLEKKVRGGKRMRNEALARRSLEETDRLAGIIRTLAGEE